MMPFGRTPMAMLVAFALLVGASVRGDDPGDRLQTATPLRPAATVPPPSAPSTPGVVRSTTTTNTTIPGDTTTSSVPLSTSSIPGTSTTEPEDDGGQPQPSTSTTSRPASTTTTLRCPSGTVAWDVSFRGREESSGRWSVTVSGTIRNEADAPVRVGPVTSTIQVRPPPGSTQQSPHRLTSEVADPTLPPGASTTFTGTATVESESPPSLDTTVVGRQWDDDRTRTACSPP